MLILALDTTSEYGGVALYRDTNRLVMVPNDGPPNFFAVTLFHMIDRALAEARERCGGPSLSLSNIDLFAAASGPGSFTGIRVGLAAAQGWSKAFKRPAKGVSVLEAMVEEVRPETEWAVPILDARRGEFFVGAFRRPLTQAYFKVESEGLVLKPEELKSLLEQLSLADGDANAITCLVREQDQLDRRLGEVLPKSLRGQNVPTPYLDAIARVALRAHMEGTPDSPSELDALYLRRSDAEIMFSTPGSKPRTEC